jgi:hypothetical protein
LLLRRSAHITVTLAGLARPDKIQPNELARLASYVIKCPKCVEAFNDMGNRKPLITSREARLKCKRIAALPENLAGW